MSAFLPQAANCNVGFGPAAEICECQDWAIKSLAFELSGPIC